MHRCSRSLARLWRAAMPVVKRDEVPASPAAPPSTPSAKRTRKAGAGASSPGTPASVQGSPSPSLGGSSSVGSSGNSGSSSVLICLKCQEPTTMNESAPAGKNPLRRDCLACGATDKWKTRTDNRTKKILKKHGGRPSGRRSGKTQTREGHSRRHE